MATNPISGAAAPAIARYEYREVNTGERKTDETQRETDSSVVALVGEFLEKTAGFYTPEDQNQYGAALYGAMNSAGAAMPGLGPADTYPFPVLHSVTSAQSFYQYCVSQSWKELTAEQLGVEWTSPLVKAAWKQDVTNGQNMDETMLDLGSTGLRQSGWLSPDSRMAVPTASTREQANGIFFDMCHIVSLAPEWYPDGLVNLNPSPLPACVRPVSFDGMTSPLWVQRPPDQHAATGGDALETLTQVTIPLRQCLPLQSYIVTDEMCAALTASPSVNDYSNDLDLAASGGTQSNQELGKQERSIVEQVRQARTQANIAFSKQAPSGTSVPPLVQSATVTNQRSVQPLPRKRTYTSIAELKQQMIAWATAGLVEHRGQQFPAERFQREAEASPERAAQIVQAAAELLAESSDSRVLQMSAQLGDDTHYAPYYEALLGRLEKGVPEGPGIRSRTLREDLLKRLADRIPSTDAALAPRAHALLKQTGRPDIRLSMLTKHDPAGEIIDVLEEACQSDADPSLIALSAARIAARTPAMLPRAASVVARQKQKAREMFLREVQRVAPSWMEQHGDDLKQRLG